MTAAGDGTGLASSTASSSTIKKLRLNRMKSRTVNGDESLTRQDF